MEQGWTTSLTSEDLQSLSDLNVDLTTGRAVFNRQLTEAEMRAVGKIIFGIVRVTKDDNDDDIARVAGDWISQAVDWFDEDLVTEWITSVEFTAPPEVVAALQDVQHQFFTVEVRGSTQLIDDSIQSLPREFQELGESFRENLIGAAAALRLPYQITFGLTIAQMQGRYEAEGTDSASFAHHLLNTKGLGEKVDGQARLQLLYLCQHPQIVLANQELLRQGVLLFWNAFEILCRDLFIELLNRHPELATRLSLEDETTKKW